jgi:hypothetical protein
MRAQLFLFFEWRWVRSPSARFLMDEASQRIFLAVWTGEDSGLPIQINRAMVTVPKYRTFQSNVEISLAHTR